MTVSIVRKSLFGPSFSRLDAEYVEKEGLAAEARIRQKFSGVRLEDIVLGEQEAAETDAPVAAGEAAAVKYISIDSVDTVDGLAFESEYLSASDLPSRAQYVVSSGDILVSNVRPNRGAVTLIRDDQSGVMASSGFSLVRLKPECGYSPEYVFTLLKTPYMRDQLVRRGRGSMYPAVLRPDVLDLFCPHPTSKVAKTVEDLISRAQVLQAKFFELKKKSEESMDKFIKEIGAPPSPMETKRKGVDWTQVRSRNFFSPEGAQRFDAEFFRKEYAEFDSRCRKAGPSFLLEEHFELSPGRALKFSEKSTSFAKQGILTNFGINWSALEEAEGELMDGAWEVRENDILLACTAHEIAYIGRKVDLVSDIPASINGKIGCVPDLMIIRPKGEQKSQKLSLHYVAAFLRHPAGLHQVQRCIRGLRGGHVYKSDLQRFVRVPLPERSWMNRFEKIRRDAEVARNEAKTLVQRAIYSAS